MFNDIIVLAGGSGTRLWPASTSKYPKQFLSIGPQQSFFTSAIERAFAVLEDAEDSRVIIVCGQNHIEAIINSCAVFSETERKRLALIPEPEAKNTAPAITAGLIYSGLINGNSDRKILVLTSDHIISPLEVFKDSAAIASVFVLQNNLVIFGIPPLFPHTGYGYIETAEPLSIAHGINPENKKNIEHQVYRTASFREKPDVKTAEEFIRNGCFYWNSGMFAFTSKFMFDELRREAADVLNPFLKLAAPSGQSCKYINGIVILDKWKGLDSAYRTVQGISFDYAIMEKCRQSVMVKAAFQWTDIGSWDEYIKLMEKSGKQDTQETPGVFRIGSESSYIDSDIPIALVDADDLIVVIRAMANNASPAALIAKKGETQKVKDIVERIKAEGKSWLL